jgi:hypothetical protein
MKTMKAVVGCPHLVDLDKTALTKEVIRGSFVLPRSKDTSKNDV